MQTWWCRARDGANRSAAILRDVVVPSPRRRSVVYQVTSYLAEGGTAAGRSKAGDTMDQKQAIKLLKKLHRTLLHVGSVERAMQDLFPVRVCVLLLSARRTILIDPI